MEMLNSDKLKAHFEDNPRDMALLKHDQTLQQSKQQPQLKFVPKYLLQEKKKIKKATLVPATKKKQQRKRPRRGTAKDPLKTFSIDEPVSPNCAQFFVLFINSSRLLKDQKTKTLN